MRESWGKHTSSTPASFSCRKNKLALQSGRSAPTLTPLLHPPTTMHLPRSACKQPDARCCCLVQLGEGAGSWSWRGISHPSVPSHRASWPCQPSLGEAVKTFPSRGLWCSFEQSIQKTSSTETALQPGAESPRSGDQRETPPCGYLAAAFSTRSLFLLNTTRRLTFEMNPVFHFWFHCSWFRKAVWMFVFFSLDDAKSCPQRRGMQRI